MDVNVLAKISPTKTINFNGKEPEALVFENISKEKTMYSSVLTGVPYVNEKKMNGKITA